MSDDDTTAQLPAGEPPPEEPRSGGPRRLLRSRRDRMIAGVAGGLGRYFNVDPVIVRIAFAISVFFGGLGAIAYVALALFVPTEPGEDGEIGPPPVERSRGLAIGVGDRDRRSRAQLGRVRRAPLGPRLLLEPVPVLRPARRRRRPGARRAAGAPGGGAGRVFASIMIGIAAFVALSIVALGAAWAGATGHGVIVAAVVIAIGVMLAVAAFSGGARWLIAPALALAIPLGVVSAADVSFGDGIGERSYRPLTVASIPADGYELGVGRLAVDLRDLDWKPDTVVDLNVDLGIGEGVVAVPSNVCVTTDLDARGGVIRVAGDQSDGVDVHSQANDGSTATPRLDLTGEVDFGELRVVNSDDADIDQGGRFHFDDGLDRGQMSANLRAACAPPTSPPADAGDAGGGAGGSHAGAGHGERHGSRAG